MCWSRLPLFPFYMRAAVWCDTGTSHKQAASPPFWNPADCWLFPSRHCEKLEGVNLNEVWNTELRLTTSNFEQGVKEWPLLHFWKCEVIRFEGSIYSHQWSNFAQNEVMQYYMLRLATEQHTEKMQLQFSVSVYGNVTLGGYFYGLDNVHLSICPSPL